MNLQARIDRITRLCDQLPSADATTQEISPELIAACRAAGRTVFLEFAAGHPDLAQQCRLLEEAAFPKTTIANGEEP
jgi:hypothetical protein